jgi:hypothetical protein
MANGSYLVVEQKDHLVATQLRMQGNGMIRESVRHEDLHGKDSQKIGRIFLFENLTGILAVSISIRISVAALILIDSDFFEKLDASDMLY